MKTIRLLGMLVAIVGAASCGRGSSDAPAKDTPPAAKEAASEAETPNADTVTLKPEVQRRLRITVTPVREQPLAVPITLTGSVQPIDSRVSHLRPLARGRIQDVMVRAGDRVTKDQPLAEFDSIEAGELLTQAQTTRSDLARLQVQLAAANRQLDRQRKLGEIGAVPQKDVEAAIAEQQQLAEAVHAQESTLSGLETRLRRYGVSARSDSTVVTIRAPFPGTVVRVNAAPGSVVDGDADLFVIADLSRVYVQAQVYERDLGHVRMGQAATIRAEAYPDTAIQGRVSAIGDVVDPQTRTVVVRCELPNDQGRLKLDMFVRVELPTSSATSVLAVPSDAVQKYEDKSVVFIQTGEDTFAVRAVEIGRVAVGLTEITRGLAPGDRVVTQGAFQVKSALSAKSLGEKEKE